MKMNQIVYVVVDKDNKILIGAYNEYADALETLRWYNSPAVSITPVLVDSAPDYSREFLYDEQSANEMTQCEIDLADTIEKEEEKDEDEDDDYDEDEDEEYEEYDEEEDEDENEDDACDFQAFVRFLESLM